MRRRAQIALASAALLAVASAVCGAPQNRRHRVERLNPDLVPYIPDPKAVLAVLRVESCEAKPVSQEQSEDLAVRLETLDVIQGPGLKPGDRIEVPGRRLADEEARFRSRFDQWNVLPLGHGDLLAMALAPGSTQGVWIGLAAVQVPSAKDPVVGALKRASAIEHMAPDARPPALEEALSSPSSLLQRYAIHAVGRRRLVPREQGAEMIARALFSPRMLPDGKAPLALELASRDFYHYEEGAEAVNVIVVRTLARLLVAGGPQQDTWTQLLGASLAIEFSKDPAKDAEMRGALIHSVGEPVESQVVAALERQTGKDPRVPKLIKAWRTAH